MEYKNIYTISDYTGAVIKCKEEYAQAISALNKESEKRNIEDNFKRLIVGCFDCIIAYNLIQSLKGWKRNLSNRQIDFLNDLFEETSLQEFCIEFGLDINWRSFEISEANLNKVFSLLQKRELFDTIVMILKINNRYYLKNGCDRDPLVMEIFDAIKDLSTTFAMLVPEREILLVNSLIAKKKFSNFYLNYIFYPSMVDVYFTQNDVVKIDCDYSPVMGSDYLTQYIDIMETVAELAKNKNFSEAMKNDFDSSQALFDFIMPLTDIVIHYIVYKACIANKTLSYEEKEFLKNSTEYGDLLKSLRFDIDWDEYYNNFYLYDQMELKIDDAIEEDNILAMFAEIVLFGIAVNLGIDKLTEVKMGLVLMGYVAPKISLKSDEETMKACNIVSNIINDLWNRVKSKFRKLGYDVNI